MLFARRFVSGPLTSGASLAPLLLMALVAGVNVLTCPPSTRCSPNALLPVMSLYAISAVAAEPRLYTPVALSLIPFQYVLVTAVLFKPEPDPAAPQSVAADGVLEFDPKELVVTPQVLSWMSSCRNVTD